jgi:Rieske Fe-S protein
MPSDFGSCEGCPGCEGHLRVSELRGVETAVTRRMFVERSALLAAAAMLAACAGSDATAPTLTGQTQINVANYPALANVGGVALVTIEGSPVALVRTGATTFLALSRICPHQGGLIVTTAGGFQCTRHGATFSSTGSWTGGQRTSNMRSYPTAYDSATSTLTVG